MKKICVLFIVLSLVFSFASCSGGPGIKGEYAPGNLDGIYVDSEKDPAQAEGNFAENPFVSVGTEAVSTISADVDTVSYSLYRKLVNSGSVFYSIYQNYYYFHTEEMVNYFGYDYALPKEDELFGVTATISDCPWNPSSKLMILGLQTEELQQTKANNLVFLIDVSGSMSSQSKLPLVKKAFAYLIDNLTANDTVSIVTYAGNAGVKLDGCSGADKQKITNAVNSLKAGGSTYGQAGLELAYNIAEKHFVEGGNNRIIIASDGDFNVGISSSESMTDYIKNKRGMGINCSALWFGDGIESYGVNIMEAIANNGGGVYYYIDGTTEAEKVFGTDLCATLNTIANDVKIQLSFDENCIKSYRLVGYENRVMSNDEFDDDTKDAAEVGAGHSVTVMYELQLAEGASQADDWMKLSVRYKRIGEEKSTLNEYSVGSADFTESPSEDFIFASAVAQTSMILNRSKYVGGRTLADVREMLTGLELDDPYKKEFITLLNETKMR